MAKALHPLSKQAGGTGAAAATLGPLGLTVEQLAQKLEGKPRDAVERLFAMLDTDGTGRLTPNELRPIAAFGNEL